MARRYDPAAARDFLEPWLVRDEGDETRAFCPLDEEPGASSSPSASFNFDENLWHCKKADHGGSIALLVTDLQRAEGAGGRTFRRTTSGAAARTEETPFPYSEDDVQTWHETLMGSPDRLAVLHDERGLEDATLKQHMLGWDGSRFTIPVWDGEGDLVNVRRYLPGAAQKMLNVPGHGEHRIYGLEVLTDPDVEDILWTAGELDRLFAEQEGWHAVTQTAGEKYFDRAWGALFVGKKVWVAYDADDTGRSGATKAVDIIREHALEVHRVDIPEVSKGYDVTDVLLEDGPEGLARLVATAVDLSKKPPPPVPQTGTPVSLQGTMGEDVQGMALQVVVSVAGKQAEPYTAPRQIEARCDMSKGNVCSVCPVADFGGRLDLELRQDNLNLFRFVETGEARRDALMKELTGAKCDDRVTFTAPTNWHIEELLVQPSIDERTEGEDMKPIKRTAFSVGTHRTQTNQKVRLVGSNVVDPKTGKLRFMSWVTEQMELDIDRFELTPALREALEVFQPSEKQSPLEKCLEIARDMADNVTHIYGRDVIHVGYDLLWHSVLSFTAYRSKVTKGWLEAMAVGDTRTGKSEIAQRLISHYRSGQLLSCEGATFAGLVGGVQQIDGRWHMTWGAVPMNDRRLVVLDEASGVKDKDVIEQMSSIRSSGIAQITKISSEETSARTRLLWITNPADGSMLSENVDVGMAALRSVVPNNEDIARFDFVMALARGEVDQHVINSVENPSYAPRYGSALCEALVKWAWSLSGDRVQITRAAEHRAAELAIEMGETYTADPPLIQSENVRFKLLRIACALAARTFAIDDDGGLKVDEVHVSDAARFLNMIYGADSMGYQRKSRRTRVAQRKARESMEKTKTFLQGTPSLMTTLLAVGSTTFRMRDFSEFSGTAGRSPLLIEEDVAQLIKDGMIRRLDRGAMAMTETLIRILKDLEDEQLDDD